MVPEDTSPITVEVAYAKPGQQVLLGLVLPAASTVGQAIEASGLLVQFPELAGAALDVGLFGKVCPLGQTLKSGDRVEIYRKLLNDPKDARRQRAAKR